MLRNHLSNMLFATSVLQTGQSSLMLTGFQVHHAVVNAKHFFVPQNRERVYIWAIRGGDAKAAAHLLHGLQRTRTFEHNQLPNIRLSRPQDSPSSSLALTHNSSMKSKRWLDRCKMMRNKTDEAKSAFLAVRDAQISDLGPPSPNIRPQTVGDRRAPVRAIECVQLKLSELRARGVDIENVSVYIDAGQSAHRAPCRIGSSPCITPNALMYMSTLGRFLSSRELLGYQGIDLDDFGSWSDFSDAFLRDLAGNAFSAPVFLCVFLSVFVNAAVE
jgi:site-specific DNA-cytosine methylase